jgi:hypothetical protein
MQTIEKPSQIGKFRRSIIDILEDFSKPIPARFLKFGRNRKVGIARSTARENTPIAFKK